MVKFLKRCYVYLIFAFLYMPIMVLMVYSFNDSRSRGAWGGFTFRWYVELFQDRTIMTSLYYTLLIGITASLIATVIGTIAAFAIHNSRGLKKKLVMNLTYIPVLNPDIVTAISLMILFVFVKLRLGFVTLLLAHITFNIPYVILSVLPKLRQLNKHLYEAALDLGATPTQAFWKVIIPEIMPGIITGMLLAFTLSIDDFVISFFTTGSGVSTLSITAYSMARRGINPKINALSTIMFLLVLVLLVIVNVRQEREQKKGMNGKNGSKKQNGSSSPEYTDPQYGSKWM
ncbi:MAG: ABC transporter permease [Firmicutes bacterium]|nr:ABC transporter permease [Bacillota bacterium]MDD4264389.1 ABC transporter permease [Bacillota bacterium]MDD4694680.1 ABC transporter permease [Bacillota bacterium]